MNGHLVRRKCPPYRTSLKNFGGLKRLLTRLSIVSHLAWILEKRRASRHSTLTAPFSPSSRFRSLVGVTRVHSVQRHQKKILVRLEQLLETFASGLRVSCKIFAVSTLHWDC